MAPVSQNYISTSQGIATDLNFNDGERVVISGISGLYPQSHNVKELSKILYHKINPVTDENCRWHYDHPELSQYTGKIPEVDLFDAQFFGINYVLCRTMDTMARKTLEQTYQAIYDAGVNPSHLSNKNIGVYAGTSFSESEGAILFDKIKPTGLGIVGVSKTMLANRISYWLNIKGPSMAIDQACCSSTLALEQAYLAIKRGQCEAAIVTGTSLCLLPQTHIQYKRVIDIAKDGKTKSYDDNADGCVNSDAINVVFLQKAKNALRIYAEVVHIKSEFTGIIRDDIGPRYGFDRMPGTMTKFIQKFYKEAQVSPRAVEYVEGLGSANANADKTELQAFEEVYLEDRTDPLLVGSITSNIGFTQAASGLCGIIKVLLGYYTGELAANLHYSTPRSDMAALREGRMQILTEPRQFHRSFAAINGMSLTGINSHVLLNGVYKPKDLTMYSSNIPRLVFISGRQEPAVKTIIRSLETRPIDPEEIALLHNIHSSNIAGHMSRGYVILDVKDQKTVILSKKIQYFDDTRRPLWFVYSGMGSQWAGMGAQLMRIPIFARAIERCQHVLAAKGLDLIHIITSPDKSVFDNILHSFVGIAAVQIGLTDVLKELSLIPDGIIGHSVGELGCAYADGCLTAEEMILAAYSRGLVSVETPFIRGSMAAVGLGYKQILNLLPPEITVACHNGPDSCTISGPADKVNEFVTEITVKGVFAKEVPCSNIAYHSQYIADAGPRLLKYLSEVIKHPKPRSERWLSTSVPQERWHESTAKTNSAEYHTNNLLSPVLFEETSPLIPPNAVLVEVAPHGLLQAILKRSLSDDCRNVPLTKRGHPDNALFLLQAIGTLYTEGYNPRVEILYPKVQFPVSTETPMLSHLVEWVHVEKWEIPSHVGKEIKTASSCKFVISKHDDEHSYLQGNVVRGKTIYPFAGVLVAVWDTLAMYTGFEKRQISVQFRDVYLHVQPTLYNQRPLRLSVSIHRCNGRFEVMDEYCKIATGYIYASESTMDQNELQIDRSCDKYHLQQDDLYQLLHERDYYYSADFRSIECANESLSKAELTWKNNWVTFIDGMLQLNTLRQAYHAVSLPAHIRRIDIDVEKHLQNQTADAPDEMQRITAEVSEIDELTKCGGVTIQNITYRNLPAASKNNLKLKLLPIRDVQITMRVDDAVQQQMSSGNDLISLQITKLGDFNSLCWAIAPQRKTTGIEVKVHYAGLNIMDAKRATGSVTLRDSNNAFGIDFSGTIKSGKRVMGIVQKGAASTEVHAQPEMLWPVPSHWSLEDAATVPLAYLQAFYCLTIKTRLQRGMSILIHGGAGALGQAAVAIALAHDCTVFTTVSDMKKKLFLKKLYPKLKDEFIGNSRDDTFVDMVLSNTNGLGCDTVLCCVPTTLKNHTLRCAKLYGMTIDTTQIENRDNYYFGMFNLEYDRTYIMADFSSIFTQSHLEDRKMLYTMLSEGIVKGYVRPLSRVVYAPNEAPSAIRLLSASQHRGRVLLRMQDIDNTPQTQHRIISCTQDAGHLLVCDTQPLGMQLAERLVRRGARKLYIICENLTPYQIYKIRVLEKLNILVKVYVVNFNEENAVGVVLENYIRMMEIQGIYIVLTKRNTNLTSTVLTNIVNAVDSTARTSCPSLKYFAVVNSDNTKGYQACRSREIDRLAVTTVDLPLLGDACSREIVDAIEHAVNTSHPMLLVEQVAVKQPSLLEEINNLIDIKLPNYGQSTLQELGVTSDKIQQILVLLRDSYNLLLEEEEIFCLTIDRIKEINEIVLDNAKPVEGLATFFSYVGSDEQLSMADLVCLPTLALDLVNDNEFDPTQSYMCIVPGLEGHYDRFSVLCERLKIPALVLQPGLDHPHETVLETAQRYVQILLKKAVFKNSEFYLLGYECGVLVALEMAAILENHSMTGTVFCVGFSPNECQTELQEQLAIYETKEGLQDTLVRHMYTLLGGNDITMLNNALQSTMTWSQKVDACVGALLGRAIYSAHYVRALISTMLTHIEQVQLYKPTTHTLRSQLVLLRAATPNLPSDHSNLQQYSRQPLIIHQLQSPLGNASHDVQVTTLINKYLSSDILQSFDKRNLCHMYFVNSDIVVPKKG